MFGSEIQVLDKGFVCLDDAMADDLSVVNSARVSFASRSDYEYENGKAHLNARDKGLIRFLMTNRHGTPFEHNSFRFHIKAPLFVFREWQRHRISSYNEWSARYSMLEPEFYIPAPEHVRSQVGKPGAYTFEALQDEELVENFRFAIALSSKQAFESYEWAIDKGIAKEQARLFLPVNIYSQMFWTVNARSLMNFLSLRNSEHAMFEIREYAGIIEEIFAQNMPVTADAFVKNDRVAP